MTDPEIIEVIAKILYDRFYMDGSDDMQPIPDLWEECQQVAEEIFETLTRLSTERN